jgi:hypothetical protein
MRLKQGKVQNNPANNTIFNNGNQVFYVSSPRGNNMNQWSNIPN